MTKAELFKKYSIDESHSQWDNRTDNWMSVEVYRIMHDGKLPPQNDMSVKWITDFLDKCNGDISYMMKLRTERKKDDFGSLYLTSKRMVYSLSDRILNNINEPPKQL